MLTSRARQAVAGSKRPRGSGARDRWTGKRHDHGDMIGPLGHSRALSVEIVNRVVYTHSRARGRAPQHGPSLRAAKERASPLKLGQPERELHRLRQALDLVV